MSITLLGSLKIETLLDIWFALLQAIDIYGTEKASAVATTQSRLYPSLRSNLLRPLGVLSHMQRVDKRFLAQAERAESYLVLRKSVSIFIDPWTSVFVGLVRDFDQIWKTNAVSPHYEALSKLYDSYYSNFSTWCNNPWRNCCNNRRQHPLTLLLICWLVEPTGERVPRLLSHLVLDSLRRTHPPTPQTSGLRLNPTFVRWSRKFYSDWTLPNVYTSVLRVKCW